MKFPREKGGGGSRLFPEQKPNGCSSSREKTEESEQYSTLRVENAFVGRPANRVKCCGRKGGEVSQGNDRKMSSCSDSKEGGVMSGHSKVAQGGGHDPEVPPASACSAIRKAGTEMGRGWEIRSLGFKQKGGGEESSQQEGRKERNGKRREACRWVVCKRRVPVQVRRAHTLASGARSALCSFRCFRVLSFPSPPPFSSPPEAE